MFPTSSPELLLPSLTHRWGHHPRLAVTRFPSTSNTQWYHSSSFLFQNNHSEESKPLEEEGSSDQLSNTESWAADQVIDTGRMVLHQRHSSVISHPLGLALTVTLHGQSPEELPYLSRERRTIENDNLDSALEQSVPKEENLNNNPELIKHLFTNINNQTIQTGIHSHKEVYVESKRKMGVMDIVLSRDSGGRDRLAVIQVGLNNSDWWEKFYHGSFYVDALMESSTDGDLGMQQKQTEPLLLAALTIETNKGTDGCQSKLGVFLCIPSSSRRNASHRIISLKYTISKTLEDASKAFGLFLRTTVWFSDWLTAEPNPKDGYQLLGPTCCLVEGVDGKHVR